MPIFWVVFWCDETGERQHHRTFQRLAAGEQTATENADGTLALLGVVLADEGIHHRPQLGAVANCIGDCVRQQETPRCTQAEAVAPVDHGDPRTGEHAVRAVVGVAFEADPQVGVEQSAGGAGAILRADDRLVIAERLGAHARLDRHRMDRSLRPDALHSVSDRSHFGRVGRADGNRLNRDWMKRVMSHNGQTVPWLDEDDALHQIRSVGLIAIIRADARVDVLLEVADALLASPLTVAALVLGYANSLAAIAEVRARMGKHMLIGAANVRTRGQAVAALDSGAQFLIAPIFDRSTFQAAADRLALYIPTVRALDEIDRLVNAGVRSVRVEMDDADNQGAILLDALTGKHPPLEVVVSGAATPENLACWAQQGVLAACVGDELRPEEVWSAKMLITQARVLRTAWEAGRWWWRENADAADTR